MRGSGCFRIEPLTADQAREILGWKYPAPYDFYNPPRDREPDQYIREFLNPIFRFHAVLDSHRGLIGFCSFGIDGQVPGGDYSEDALDIGLGMKPELTGRGLGRNFFGSILHYAEQQLEPSRYRLTVAGFNRRAINLYCNFGFEFHSEFEDEQGIPYVILVRNAA
ncbi:MAG: GNAT family N-acetyltransferase [Pseudomonadales bacterium]|nr:GNAT family N-acetyltransferase [Pseudomonadales bacterium]